MSRWLTIEAERVLRVARGRDTILCDDHHSGPVTLLVKVPDETKGAQQMTGYPVILNGDHADFEAEHADTPPHERPDWPLPSFDARDWAAAFCKIAKQHGHDIDEAWMTTWFANALMRGFDEHAARAHRSMES